jgi:hypothetical protein
MQYLFISFLALTAAAHPSLIADTLGTSFADPVASTYTGYLISTFSDANPSVQFHLSNGNDATSFTFLNRGQPVLRSNVGEFPGRP